MAHINENELKSLMINTKKLHATQSVGTLRVGAEGMLMKVPAVYDLAQKEAVTKISRDLTNNQYRARLARKPVLDRMTSYFSDEDGDGVVNLQDCYPGDKSKHGFFSGIQSIYNKTVAAVGSQEMAEAARQREAERVKRDEAIKAAKEREAARVMKTEEKLRQQAEAEMQAREKANTREEAKTDGLEKAATTAINTAEEIAAPVVETAKRIGRGIKRGAQAVTGLVKEEVVEAKDLTSAVAPAVKETISAVGQKTKEYSQAVGQKIKPATSNIGTYLKEKYVTGAIINPETGQPYTYGAEGTAPKLTEQEIAAKRSVIGRIKERWTPQYLKSPEQRAKERQTATLMREEMFGTYIYPEREKAKQALREVSVKEAEEFGKLQGKIAVERQKAIDKIDEKIKQGKTVEVKEISYQKPPLKSPDNELANNLSIIASHVGVKYIPDFPSQHKLEKKEIIKQKQIPYDQKEIEEMQQKSLERVDKIYQPQLKALQAKYQTKKKVAEENIPSISQTYATPTLGRMGAKRKEMEKEKLTEFQLKDMERKIRLSELNLINEAIAIKAAKARAKGSSYSGELNRNIPYVSAPQTQFVAPTYYGAPRPTAAPIFMEYTPSRGRPTEVAQEFGFTSGFGINQIPMPSAGPTQGIGTPQDLGNFFIQPKQAPIQRPQMPKGANMFPNGTTPKPRVYPKRGEFKGGKVRGFGSLSKVGKKARPTYNRQATAGLTSTGADFTKLKKLPQQKQSSTEYRQQRQYRDYHLVKMYGDRGKQIVEERGRSLTPIKHRKPKMY